MREFPDTLTPDQVYRFAVDFCQPHVDFHPAGKITATTLVTVSFAAAARNSSISGTCRRHDTSPIPCHDLFNQVGLVEPATLLPRRIALPMCDVCARLDRRPILSYDGYALYNWKRFDPTRPIALVDTPHA